MSRWRRRVNLPTFSEEGKPMSRYPQPGALVPFWQDCEPCVGECFVLATSRHCASFTEADALNALRDYYGWDSVEVTDARIGTWRSVTRRDVEMGDAGEADEGGWAESASGAAWVRVAYPLFAQKKGSQ